MTKTDALPRLAGATILSLLAIALCAIALPASSLAAPPEGSGLPLVASPPSLSFEKTTVGNQAPSREVDLYNEGEEEAPIDKIAIEGDDAAAFSIKNNNCGPLGQYAHCGLWFTFMPNSAGEKHATVHIVFKNSRPEETFEISGAGVEPQLTISPDPYDFGLQRVYEARGNYFQVTNSGEATVPVNNYGISGGSDSFWTDNNTDCWSHPLAPGESCSVQAYFNPQDALEYEAELWVGTGSYTFGASLSGQGGRAIIDASPNPAEFGATTVGAKGAVRTITLSNSGNFPAGFFIGIVAGGDSGSFQLLSENCSGELQPAASCSAQVRFAPLSAGAKLARLAFFGDSDAGAQIVLTGEGVAPAATLAPSVFDFGTLAAGSKSDSHTFAVRNEGSTPLDLGSASIVGADLDQFALAGDECTGETLAPATECLVRVRFAPDSAGAKAARLRIGGSGSAFIASLVGTGSDASSSSSEAAAETAADDRPPPPRPWRQGRHRRFARGDAVPAGRVQRPRRAQVRASTLPR